MARTNRKNRYGKTHKEGRDMVFRCRCEYCTGKSRSLDRESVIDFNNQLKELDSL